MNWKLNLRVLIVFVLMGFLSTSCSEDDPKPVNLVGIWEGTSDNDFYLKLQLSDDGKLLVFVDEGALDEQAAGTWTYTDDGFRTTYIYYNNNLTISAKADFDKKTNTLVGTWGNGAFATGGGDFEVTRQ